MPTYVCYLPPFRFNGEQKRQIAASISHRHSEATGAPSYFVQVMVEEVAGERYLGGEKTDGHVWLRGDIRSGRTETQRTSMMLKMMQDISQITGVVESDIWVYICNLAPTDMVEYGHVLPRPGDERQWFLSLPSSLQRKLEGLGTTEHNFKL